MHISYKDTEIFISIDSGPTAAIDKAYLKQFDGATVKFTSTEEGDRLTIIRKG